MLTTGSRRVYFVGDTGYHETLFSEIQDRCGRPDLALVPIGAYAPRWFMQSAHVDPAEAVRIHQQVGAVRSIAMHWGTFQLTDEGREDPVRSLNEARLKAGIAPEEFTALETGDSVAI